ncbi:hypothetical protein OS176_08920 [Xanthomonadaceae bacterium XH05]|nr:hypothetical protein [Xanthomonadaceae bacterium XH05]
MIVFRTVLLLFLSAGSSLEAVEHHEGLAYRLEGGPLLYSEHHWRLDIDGIATRIVLYRCPDGRPFARKQVREITAATSPDFELLDARDGYREGVRSMAGRREMFWQADADAQAMVRDFVPDAGTVIDAGFDAYVRQHWEGLLAGERGQARFLLPSALRLFPVRLWRHDDGMDAGEVGFRMRLDAWYGFAVPQTLVVYRVSDRRLLRFEGTGSIRDPRGRHRPVRIVFAPQSAPAPESGRRQALDALQLPLDGRCPT